VDGGWWEFEEGEREKGKGKRDAWERIITIAQCSMPNAQCPMPNAQQLTKTLPKV
jgi:hypothetical protein